MGRMRFVTQIIAAFILAAGAFYGVYKGAVYAVERLSAQLGEERRLSEERLDADAKRLQMQLDAESARLDKQLAHDRWMREVEELRRLVDEAGAAGITAGNVIHVFRSQVRWIVDEDGTPNKHYAEKRRAAQDAVAAMQGFVERFELRLGTGHDVPESFGSWQLAQEEAIEAFETIPATKEVLQRGGERLKTAAGRYLEFMDAARPYVRLDPPKPG